jgi:hypothetical protein
LQYFYKIVGGKEMNNEWISVKDKLPGNIISNLSWLVPFVLNYWKQGNADRLVYGSFQYEYYENA